MASSTDEVQGTCAYVELKKVGATATGVSQAFIFPEGFDEDANEVQAQVLRRVLRTSEPNPDWAYADIPQMLPAPAAPDGLLDEDWEAYGDFRLRYVASIFEQAVADGWSLVGPPLVIEMSKKDFSDVREHAIPHKVIARMDRCRTASGYPAEYI